MCNSKLKPKDATEDQVYIGADKLNPEAFLTDTDGKIKATQDKWDSFVIKS